MSSKIEVSREQLERWTTGRISLSHLEEIRDLLAANPEENGPCPQCGGSLSTWGCTCEPRWPSYKPDISSEKVHQANIAGEIE